MNKESSKKRQKTNKGRRPSKLDRDVYLQHGMAGRFNPVDLMDEHETADFDNLPEAKVQQIDEKSAAVTLDLLMKYRKTGVVPVDEWNRAVTQRLGDGVEPWEKTDAMVFESDEKKDSDEEHSEGSEEVISIFRPQQVSWERYSIGSLQTMPHISFCGALKTDYDIDMSLQSMLSKKKSLDQWKSDADRKLSGKYFTTIDLSEGKSVLIFRIGALFAALYLQADGRLVNYFYLQGLPPD